MEKKGIHSARRSYLGVCKNGVLLIEVQCIGDLDNLDSWQLIFEHTLCAVYKTTIPLTKYVSQWVRYSPADFWVACATRESPISYFFACFFFFACLFSSSFLNFLRANLSCKSMAVNMRIGATTKCNHINEGIVAKVIIYKVNISNIMLVTPIYYEFFNFCNSPKILAKI